MICLNCKNPMIVVEHNRIELDYCPNCQGVWFDSGELELLLESAGSENLKLSSSDIREANAPEKSRRCPLCLRKMKKATIGEEPKIVVDVCWRRDGLWFDGGELSQLLGQLERKMPEKLEAQAHQQIVSFLHDVFKTPQ